MSSVLITGFPGFLAKNIIKELRQQKVFSTIYVLVLPAQLVKADEVIQEISKDNFNDQKVVIVEGDITLPNAGINRDHRTAKRRSEICVAFSSSL